MSARDAMVKQLPCLACEMEQCKQPSPTESHHQNIGGKAGQKRLGAEYTVPLCSWHHRGEPPEGYTKQRAFYAFGPSLAGHSRLFRLLYGSDEVLLAKTNARLEVPA